MLAGVTTNACRLYHTPTTGSPLPGGDFQRIVKTDADYTGNREPQHPDPVAGVSHIPAIHVVSVPYNAVV